MRVSYEWLREYLTIDLTIEELAEKMTMSGIAVEEIEDMAAPYQKMVIAKVLSLEKHREADNLLVARLDAGSYGKKQVITAATNLKTGDLVPLALPGAVLSDGRQIAELNFKGVLSEGMMCSGAELGLEKESSGIWIFDEPLQPGASVADALNSNDRVLVLELTANRSDCMGMINVAREIAAILDLPCKLPEPILKEEGPSITDLAAIQIDDPDLCPRYAARAAIDLKIGPSPAWMQRRLKAAGIRPINNIVDITNYVMLEYNQPLHAFDLDRISQGRVIVRRARNGEKFATLDEIERQFTADDLLIADPGGGLCVAGVMGGQSSEVTEATVNLLLEAAYFNPLSIRRTARSLGMRTEASLRFERGVDPNNTVNALNRAAQLIEILGCGKIARGVLDEYPQPLQPVRIATNVNRINAWLGTDLTGEQICGYLKRVNFEVKTGDGGRLEVEVPTYRRDVTQMADLAEEVARLHGYDRIAVTLPESRQLGERTPFQKMQLDCRRLLQGAGISEIMTYSFYSKKVPELLRLTPDDPGHKMVELMMPLSEEQAVMRTGLAHGILTAIAFNVNRRQTDLAFYEIGRIYLPTGDLLPDEPVYLGVGLTGRKNETGWNQPDQEYDFYDLKGILEIIWDRFGLPQPRLTRSNRPYLHPGQSAEVFLGDKCVGYLGQVHPGVLKNYQLTKAVFLMELNLSSLAELIRQEIVFEPLPKFPAIQRDLALVVSDKISADQIAAAIKDVGGGLTERVELFDVYQGDQVGPGQRSLAFSITYRSPEKTLNDQEVNEIQAKMLQRIKEQFGAVVRG
ncbi:MAG: phenylalanine--tRNA ligase subunit beta [Firmicutes bacterium]|nr:phenylalanine--tRNA ligase subunit beta [Bacillota bacterium]